MFQNSVAIYLEFYGENNISVAGCYYKIGNAYEELKENFKALEYYQKSLEIYKKFCKPGNPLLKELVKKVEILFKSFVDGFKFKNGPQK